MTGREMLREQAEMLWRMIESSDGPQEFRKELRQLACACEDILAADDGRGEGAQSTEAAKALRRGSVSAGARL